MDEIVDKNRLSKTVMVRLEETGTVVIIDESDPFLPNFTLLEAQAALTLLDFLRLHQERLERHARASGK